MKTSKGCMHVYNSQHDKEHIIPHVYLLIGMLDSFQPLFTLTPIPPFAFVNSRFQLCTFNFPSLSISVTFASTHSTALHPSF